MTERRCSLLWPGGVHCPELAVYGDSAGRPMAWCERHALSVDRQRGLAPDAVPPDPEQRLSQTHENTSEKPGRVDSAPRATKTRARASERRKTASGPASGPEPGADPGLLL